MGLDRDFIGVHKSSWLKRPFEKKEVKDVVSKYFTDKSPGCFFYDFVSRLLGCGER